MSIRNNKAFTLVELVIIVLIISILGTIALVNLQRAPDDTVKKANLVIELVREYETNRGQIKNDHTFEIVGAFGADGDLLFLVKFYNFEEGVNHYLVNTKTGDISASFKFTDEEMENMFPVDETDKKASSSLEDRHVPPTKPRTQSLYERLSARLFFFLSKIILCDII